MKTTCEVSIIMSVYNGEKYISEAIQSILEQTFDNWELLITDDCSTDNTLSIIRQYEKLDTRIRVYENETNQGLTKNLNAMIQKASGKYIARLDADDISMSDRIEVQYKYLEEYPDVHMVCAWAEAIGEKSYLMKAPESFESLAVRLLFGNSIVHSSVMFRKDMEFIYDENCLKAQDYELWERMVAKGKIIAPIQKVLVKFRYHHNQISATYGTEQQKTGNMIRRRMLKRLGISFSENELTVYNRFLNTDEITGQEDVNNIDSILSSMLRANKEAGHYNQRLLGKTIAFIYARLLSSVKRSNIQLEKKVSIKLFVKSLSINSIKRYVYEAIEHTVG